MNNFSFEQTLGKQYLNFNNKLIYLGQGSFAIVKLATERLNSRKVAIKIYDKVKLHDP